MLGTGLQLCVANSIAPANAASYRQEPLTDVLIPLDLRVTVYCGIIRFPVWFKSPEPIPDEG